MAPSTKMSDIKIAADAAENTFGRMKLISPCFPAIAPERNDHADTRREFEGQEAAWGHQIFYDISSLVFYDLSSLARNFDVLRSPATL
jgi:hypothetical protein